MMKMALTFGLQIKMEQEKDNNVKVEILTRTNGHYHQ